MKKHNPYFDNLFYHENLKKQKPFILVNKGDLIHLHTFKGTYRVVDVKPNMVKITCKSWINDRKRYRWIINNDVKCKYGGVNV